MNSNQEILDKLFLTYSQILNKFERENIKTKNGKTITHQDLRKAILVMTQEHHNCRWLSNKALNKKHLILIEGYLWLKKVYFQREKTRVDADIIFFKQRIKEYEKLLNIEKKRSFWNKDMSISEASMYFDRKYNTIKRNVIKLDKNYIKNGKITKEGIEQLCKNVYKKKYLKLLEEYKMVLTEKYIEQGYPYDDFFGKN